LEDWRARIAEKHAAYLAEQEEVELRSRSVGVIGAGLAGLSAAYELRKRGYAVTILEAFNIPGGRTRTVHHLVKHHGMDGGAELIGSNHALWLWYARIFRLGFSEVLEYKNSPIMVGTTRLSPNAGKSLVGQMGDALDYISARANTIVDPFFGVDRPPSCDVGQAERSRLRSSHWVVAAVQRGRFATAGIG